MHVDYLLRADILELMQQRWFELTIAGHHDVTAALIREGQLELACDKIDQMQRDGLKVQDWLLDMAVYALVESGELDEALFIMKERLAGWDTNISKSVWHALLDAASSVYHVRNVYVQ